MTSAVKVRVPERASGSLADGEGDQHRSRLGEVHVDLRLLVRSKGRVYATNADVSFGVWGSYSGSGMCSPAHARSCGCSSKESVLCYCWKRAYCSERQCNQATESGVNE